MDYVETYALVVKLASVCVFLDFASVMDLLRHQLDVVTALPIGDLTEVIHMKQPQGFLNSDQSKTFCCLLH